MKALEYFLHESFNDPQYHVRMREKYNVDAKHAAFEIKMKVRDKAYKALNQLCEEVNKFNSLSPRVKHGFYAGQLPFANREMLAVVKKIENKEIAMVAGLDKLINLAHNHRPIKDAAIKLRAKQIHAGDLAKMVNSVCP